MPKPNDNCTCGSKKKYKKCCSLKDRRAKKPTMYGGRSTGNEQCCPCGSGKSNGRCDCEAEAWAKLPPERWKDYGMVDPSLRFSVGQRVECYCPEHKRGGGYEAYLSESKWIPARVVNLKARLPDPRGDSVEVAYICYPDVIMDLSRVRMIIRYDTPEFIRPCQMTKTSKPKCSNCGVDDALNVKLSACSRCKRFYYCSRECQKQDHPKHKAICKAIVNEKKRLSDEAKELVSTATTPEQLFAALISAVQSGEGGDLRMIKRLLKKKQGCFDINATTSAFGISALLMACDTGFTAAVDLLLQANHIQVNQACSNDRITALIAACQEGHSSVVNLLLKANGIKVNQQEIHGATALYYATQFEHISCVKLLLSDSRVDVNISLIESGITPLWRASQDGRTNIVELLLQNERVDVNQPTTEAGAKDGATPLYIACQNGHSNTVEKLLRNDRVNINRPRNCDGWTPLHVACANGYTPVIKLLLDQPEIEVNRPNNDATTAMWAACQSGKTAVLELLLKTKGIEVNMSNDDGITSLWVACEKGNSSVVTLLLLHNADVNQPMNDGCTPLYVACEQNQTKIVNILLKVNNIDVNRSLNNGCSPLWIACRRGNLSIVKVLVGVKGIDVNHSRNDGITPLGIAQHYNHDGIVKLLLNSGLLDEKARRSNAIEKMFRLGLRYMHGEGVDQSDELAREWWTKAANEGHETAIEYLKRLDTQEDKEEAAFYTTAAKQGDTDAMCNLGVMYIQGRGLDQSNVLAREWWTKAASKGSEGAVENLKFLDEQEGKSTSTATTTASASPPPVCCSSCNKPQPSTCKFQRCTGCGSVQYCNKDCQRTHWKTGGHKQECKRLRKKKEQKVGSKGKTNKKQQTK